MTKEWPGATVTLYLDPALESKAFAEGREYTREKKLEQERKEALDRQRMALKGKPKFDGGMFNE